MENTGKVLFGSEKDVPEWFVAIGEGSVGPFSASDVYQKILKTEITWAHFVWKAGQSEWMRICDVPTFQAAVPKAPSQSPKTPAQTPQASKGASAKTAPGSSVSPPAPKTEKSKREWFLYYNDSQFGPFSEEEIKRFLSIGKINGRVHAWKDGMAGWARLENIDGFMMSGSGAKKSGPPSPPQSEPSFDIAFEGSQKGSKKGASKKSEADKRTSPRRPLVARVVLAQNESVGVGVCRDISVGGMQVLIDPIPGDVGSKLKLNVSPSIDSAKKSKLRPFVAQGLIVRILEDGRGFSFRFEKLSDDAKRAINKYIAEEAKT